MISRIQIWLAAVGAAVLAFTAAYLRGRAHGADAEQSRQTERALDAARTRQEVEDEIAKAGDDRVRDMLDEWMRDSNQK